MQERKRYTQYERVPAGTPASNCKGPHCQAIGFWIERLSRNKATPTRKVRLMIDCDADERCHRPTATEDGLGVSHFSTCPDARRFSHP